MFVLAGQSHETIADEKSTETSMNDVRGKKTQPGTTHCVQIGVGSPSPEICGEKVLHIRQQLAEGKYDFDNLLNVAFGKLLDELFGQGRETRSLTGS